MQNEPTANPTRIPSRAVDLFPDFLVQNVEILISRKSVGGYLNQVIICWSSKHPRISEVVWPLEEIIEEILGVKSFCGRRVKRLEWKVTLFNMIDDEFRRLREIGVKISRILALEMAMKLANNPNEPVSVKKIGQASGTEIIELITLRFVDSFLELKYSLL